LLEVIEIKEKGWRDMKQEKDVVVELLEKLVWWWWSKEQNRAGNVILVVLERMKDEEY